MSRAWWVEIKELDEDQKAILELPLRGNYIVKGPPGSGKTNLLLLRANYLHRADRKNLQVVVFTRALREFIVAGGIAYAFPSDKVVTSNRFFRNLLFENGLAVDPPDNFNEQRQYFIRHTNDLIDNKGLQDLFEVILLDEAQDYLPEELALFETLAEDLYLVADSRQQIYRNHIGAGFADLRDLQHVELKYHYRNGRKICELADGIQKSAGDSMLAYSNYDETTMPSTVEHFKCKDVDDEVARIIVKLELQVKAYPDELIAVMCPTRKIFDEVIKQLLSTSLASKMVVHYGKEHSAFNLGKAICICTFHAAKGLEFRAVHLVGCEGLKKMPLPRNLLFTAVTRAKTSLSIYYTSEIHGFFESALASLTPVTVLPPLEDAFGKR